MDILTHMALGASSNHLLFHKKFGRKTLMWGSLAALFPDLDTLFRLPHSPGLNLLIHRSFTHSLILWPLFSALVAWIIFCWYKKRNTILNFCELWGVCSLALLTHLGIDWLNSYGTYLLWPISFDRYYLDLVPIVDPLLTLPFILFFLIAFAKDRWKFHFFSWGWLLIYLFVAYLQHEQVLREQAKLVLGRGQEMVKGRALPSIGNLFSWRSLYRTTDKVYYDNVVCFPLILPQVEMGGSQPLAKAENLLTTYLNDETIHNNFHYLEKFSDGFIAFLPSEKNETQVVGDLRYIRDIKTLKMRTRMEFDRSNAAHPISIRRQY